MASTTQRTEVPLADQVEEWTMTAAGPVQGFTYGDARVFLGIPYAEAPVGELRMELPVRKRPWTETIACQEYGPSAIPHTPHVFKRAIGDDDLRMNVMCPIERRPGGHPVVFHLHPSAFMCGSPDLVPYQAFADNFCSRGIIVVNFTFRVGPFGFASTGDSVMPGNYGMHDLELALDWVRRNIATFGGNPNDLTAWGFSSGGQTASLLASLPRTAPHFRRAICSSGTPFSGLSFGESVVPTTLELARELGVRRLHDSHAIKAAFKSATPEELYEAHQRIGTSNATVPMKWGPRIDGDIVPEDLEKMIAKAPKMPILCGWTTEESLYFFHRFLPGCHGLGITDDMTRSMDVTQLADRIRNLHIVDRYFGAIAAPLQQDVVDFYTADKENLSTPADCIQREVHLLSHLYFSAPGLMEARLRAARGQPVFLYQNSHWREDHFRTALPARGAMHMVELKTLFGLPLPSKYDMNAEDLAVKRAYVESYVNFIKTDDPSFDQVRLQPISAERPNANLRICARPQAAPDLGDEQPALDFWMRMLRKYGPVALRTNRALPRLARL